MSEKELTDIGKAFNQFINIHNSRSERESAFKEIAQALLNGDQELEELLKKRESGDPYS